MILSVGLTPAWQRILQFDRLAVGEVNRARATQSCASGKVLNVAAAAHSLGAEASLWCPIGGATGRQISADFRRLGIPSRWLEVATPTRVCTTLLDLSKGVTTELVENAGALSATDLDRYAEELPELAAGAALVVLTGSLPERTPAGYYRRLLRSVECPAVLDIRGQDLLDCLPLKPLLIKPNRDELGWTVGRALAAESEVLAAMQELQGHGAQWVVVSQGAGMLLAAGPTGNFRICPPHIEAVNPIGCGDSLAAGIAVGVLEGMPVIEAIRFGVAAAAENALDLLPARMSRAATDRRLAGIEIQRM